MSCVLLGLWLGPSGSFASQSSNTGSTAVCPRLPRYRSMTFPQFINKVIHIIDVLKLRVVRQGEALATG